jgi:hypothetical protein
MTEMRNVYEILVGKPEGQKPLEIPESKWYLIETGMQGVEWIHLAQDRDQWRALVNTVMNLRVP